MPQVNEISWFFISFFSLACMFLIFLYTFFCIAGMNKIHKKNIYMFSFSLMI